MGVAPGVSPRSSLHVFAKPLMILSLSGALLFHPSFLSLSRRAGCLSLSPTYGFFCFHVPVRGG